MDVPSARTSDGTGAWHHPRMGFPRAAIVSVLLVGACAPGTRIVVVVTAATGLEPVALALAETRDASGALVDGPRGFPLVPEGSTFTVVPRGGDETRVVEIRVTGCRLVPPDGVDCGAADRVARSIARTAFLPGRSFTVYVELSGPCSDVACDEGHLCRAEGDVPVCEPLATAVDARVEPAAVDAASPIDAGCVSRDAALADVPRDVGSGCRAVCGAPPPWCIEVALPDSSVEREIPADGTGSISECLAALGVDGPPSLAEAYTPTCGPVEVQVLAVNGGYRPPVGWYWADEDPRIAAQRHPLGACPTSNWACGEPAPAAMQLDIASLPGARPGRALAFYLLTPRAGAAGVSVCELTEADIVVLSTDPSRSDDPSVPHAVTYADSRAPDSWIVGFEDLAGGGDRSYEDIVLRVSGLTAGCAP